MTFDIQLSLQQTSQGRSLSYPVNILESDLCSRAFIKQILWMLFVKIITITAAASLCPDSSPCMLTPGTTGIAVWMIDSTELVLSWGKIEDYNTDLTILVLLMLQGMECSFKPGLPPVFPLKAPRTGLTSHTGTVFIDKVKDEQTVIERE